MKNLPTQLICFLTFFLSFNLSAQQASLVIDLIEGPDNGLHQEAQILGTMGNFIALENRGEILVSNGTLEGTSVIGNLGTEGRLLFSRTSLNDKIYIIIDNDDTAYSLIEIDTVGSSMKTILSDFESINNAIAYNGKIYCEVDGGGFGTAFISLDPNTGATEEIFPVDWFGGMRSAVVHNGLIYTIHHSASQEGTFLASTDGTPGNVNEFKFLHDGSDFSQTSSINMTSAGDNLFFWYYGPNEELYNFYGSDGTENGTEILHDNFKRIAFYDHRKDRAIGVFGNNILFRAQEMDDSSRKHLWISDGSIGGTCKVEIAGPDIPMEPRFFSMLNDELYFFGTHTEGAWSNDMGVIKTDATKDGTEVAFDGGEHEDGIFFNGWHLVAHNGKLYFSASGQYGSELYESLGTLETTIRVSDIQEGDDDSSVSNLVSAGENLFFFGTNEAYGRELYVLNSTISSTKELNTFQINIFPNPTEDIIQLQGLETTANPYQIVDMTGALLKSGVTSGAHEINVNGLSAGMYFLNVYQEDKTYRAKFFKN